MAKLASDPQDIPPRQIWNGPFRFVPEPGRSFADYLQFTLNGGNGRGIRAERLEIRPGCELLDHPDSVQDVREQALRRRLKRQGPTRAALFRAPPAAASLYPPNRP